MSGPTKKTESQKPLSTEEAWNKIVNAGEHLKILRSLDACHVRRVTEAVEVLKGLQGSPKRRAYQRFLYDVLRKSGPHAILLCAIALGQVKVVNMKTKHRADLIRNLESKKDCSSLSHRTIYSLALVQRVPKSVEGKRTHFVTVDEMLNKADLQAIIDEGRQPQGSISPISLQGEEGVDKQHTPVNGGAPLNEMQSSPAAVSVTSSNDPNLTAAQEQLVLENASLRGIAQIFDGYMCHAIRRVSIEGDSKAAITMVFPGWGGPVDCLMSLDIREWDIAQLAMDLFNAELKWVGHVLHVVLENGMTLTTETSEITLKGVEDKAIDKVFGREIHDAINECPIRKRETKRATECVSMILTKNGAIINLSLGIRGGLQIQNKLCT